MFIVKSEFILQKKKEMEKVPYLLLLPSFAINGNQDCTPCTETAKNWVQQHQMAVRSLRGGCS